MHHSSHLAWVRHKGTHQTKAVGFKCWNTELVASLNRVLTPYWVSLDSEVETDLRTVSDQMQGHLEKFRKAAKGRTVYIRLDRPTLLILFPRCGRSYVVSPKHDGPAAVCRNSVCRWYRGFHEKLPVRSCLLLAYGPLTFLAQTDQAQCYIRESYFLHVVLYVPSLSSGRERLWYVTPFP